MINCENRRWQMAILANVANTPGMTDHHLSGIIKYIFAVPISLVIFEHNNHNPLPKLLSM